MDSVSEPVLSGLRVLDLGRYIAAPYCAHLLANEGAEVIRIEPPDGAPDREVMPLRGRVRPGLTPTPCWPRTMPTACSRPLVMP